MHLLVVGILFVAAFELSLRGQSATINALNISTFTPLEGSLAGGTRLAIYGAGFDNQFTGSLSVAIGPYPCQVLVTQSSAQVVTCEASPGLSGTYWVSVTSRGPDGITATAAAWGFTYTASRTPVMRAVQPSAGPPGASIAIIGNPVDVVTRDCGPTAWGDSDCLGGIRVGRLLCAVPEGDISRIYDVRSQRLRSAGQTFQINCTMPQPQRNNPKMPSVVPGLGTAGMYNVTLAFEATSRGGRAGVHSSAWLYKADGTPYMYEQYPEVSYITPSAGSSAGGTLVTIYGRGFPDFHRGLDDKVEIQISPGMPCVVQDSVYDKITCMTSARPDKLTPDVSTAVVRGLYSGMRGAEYEVYPTGPDRTPGFRELWKLNTTIRAVDLPNGYVGVLMDTMEGRTADYGLPYHCSRMKGFFRAPRDANYTFYAAADDYAQLNGTWIQDGGGEVQQVLLNVTSPTALLDWKNLSSSQASAPIRLSSGQPILLELNHCNVLSYGTAQLGVRVSSSSPATNSLSEVQRIHVTSARVPRSVAISYMYVSSSSPPAVAVQVLVSADSPTRFSDRRLGLQLVLNVLNGLATVKLPVAATAAELTATTIAALLESHNGTVLNNTTFGIRKSISGTTLTLELGGDKEVLKAMNVVSFRLLDLGTHVIVPSITDCEFANPLLQPVTGTEAINAFTSLPSTAQTQAEALDLNLFTVTHRSAATVQTSTPAGSWQLSVQTANGSFNVDTLPYNATAEQVATAVTNLTGIEVAVYRSSNVRQGAYLATVWNITWPRLASGSSSTGRSSDSAAVTVLASPGVGFPSAAVLATEDRAASAAPSGTIRVSFGGECEWTELNVFKDPLDVIQAKLGSLPGFKAPPRDAIRVANDDGSVDVAFSYDSIANPGDQPLLRVVDTRGLVGEDPTAWVVADSTGSTDQVFFPIPVDMIHLPIPLENTITLSVNGAAAACTHPSGTCSYAYEGSLTPKITSVRPTTLSFGDGQTSALLTILGKGFTPANSSNTTNSSGLGSSSSGIGAVAVTVGGANCSVVSSNDTAVSCALQRGAVSAGKHSVVLSVPGKGYASGAGKVVISNLMISDMPPLLLSAQGMTQISINGEGFGSTEAECSNLRLLIGDVACWTVSCTPTSLTAIFPGGPVGVNLPVKLQVLESGTVVVDYTAATVVAAVDDLAPAVLLHTASVGALGGDIMLTLLPEGMTADLIASISLVPAVNTSPAAAITGTGSSIANISTLAVAMAKAYPCSFSPADDFAEAAAGAVTTISSTAGPLPRGGYYVRVVLTEALSGLTLLSSKTLTVDLAVTDINPKVGSVGGGTSLKISGRGFSPRAVDNLVFLSVPVSTTFRTGRMPCDVLSATATEIECRTRPYFLAEVDMEDPHARKLTPTVATDLAVDVVACTWTDDATSSLETCLTKGSMARCEASSSQQQSCLFSYTASATPVFGSITPSTGQGGTEVHVLGRNLGSVVEMRFLTAAGDIQAACAASEDFGPPGTEAVMCEVPADLPLGNYSLVLITDTGGASVDPYGASTFSCQASMISVQPSAVSLAGGLPLTVTVSGADLQSLNLSTFSVTLGAGVLGSAGLPCTGLTASSATELSCMAPALTGWVLAEVWKSLDDDVLQSLDNYGDPDEVLLVEGDDFSSADSGLAAPAGAVPGRMWAGRATFYMQLLTDTEAVVSFSAVNLTELWVDGSLVGGVTQGSQTFPVTLSAGLRKLTLAFHQTTQSANTSFKLSGDTSTLEGMAWAKVTPVAPRTPLQVMVTVNGAPFEAACDEQHVPLLSSANQQASLNFEPTAVNLAAGSPSCSVVYSAYKTPTLAAEVFSLSRSGVQLPNRTASVRTLYAYGSFLSSALESEVTITVGGLDCGSKTTAVIAASASSVSGNGGTSITRLACTVPPLPLGDWPVVITVAGYGATRLPLSFWTDSPVLSSNLTDDGLLGDLSALQTTCQVSLFGGGALDLTGTSNIADLQDAIASQQLAVSWDRSDESATGACVQTAISNCSWLGRPTPPQAAVNASKLSITLDWAGGAPVVSVGRYKLADLPAPAAATTVWPELLSYIDNAAVQSSMKWRIKQASSTAAGGTSESWGLASMCGGYTPYIYELSPTTANPDMIDGEVQAQVRWRLTGVGSADGVLQTADISTPSLATLEFEPHDGSRRTLTCIQPTVISSTATETTYDETFSCRLPPYMTATQYTVWLCVQPYGCGYYPGSWGVTYQPLGFQEGFPTSGPATGGTVLGVKSSGHSMDPTAIKERSRSRIQA
ncbi:hypothetical protein Agub_g6422 [Astrephomene gubernaculifera]|uniref:PA14 domain-containing protein n=1 Tax=Astrephomene gubernaculifera TaxID=47775 RepID=A0AAD3HLJ5_9CHLO|nr:hypothetical protein Agub_g6422 [Astrephomene gubernaculifera]